MQTFNKTQDTLMKTRHDSKAQFESLLRPAQQQQLQNELTQEQKHDKRADDQKVESAPTPGRMMPTARFAQGVSQVERLKVATSSASENQGKYGFSARRKMDTMVSDIKIQQLRGIFAGFDENRDNVLEKEYVWNDVFSS